MGPSPTVAFRRPHPAVPRIRGRVLARQEVIAGVALLIVSFHLLLDASTRSRPPSVTALELAGALLVAPTAFALFIARGRLAQTALAGTAGLAALWLGVAGWVPGAVMAGRRASDLSGIALALAGIALVAVALTIALRGRRRVVQVAIALPALLVTLQWILLPAVTVGVVTHAPRASIPAAATLGLHHARDVSFGARDGVRLDGWYVPGRNGAAIVVLHGAHGDRTSTLPYLRFLNEAGYGVLAYDARGHGTSAGHTNALGWRGDDDLAGAVAFLRRQHGVDPSRLGALGLSMGGEEALRAAAEQTPLHAIVADGAGVGTLGDDRLVSHGLLSPIYFSVGWLAHREIELLSTYGEPSPLKTIVGRIKAPTLLIASNRKNERAIDEAFRARIGANATLWYVADAGHTQAFDSHRSTYIARLTRFYSHALLQK